MPESTANSREAILDRLRTRIIESPELPTVNPSRLVNYADPLAQFHEVATSVGADVRNIVHLSEVGEYLQQLTPFRAANRIASMLPELPIGNTDLRMYDDPHFLKGLDWLIARGEFGVAENGAIWMDMEHVGHRVSFFITQYLAIVLPRESIVHNMHQAYERLGPRVAQPFGLFLSGPSKTADIEQSLVLGAHGCRALTIFVI